MSFGITITPGPGWARTASGLAAAAAGQGARLAQSGALIASAGMPIVRGEIPVVTGALRDAETTEVGAGNPTLVRFTNPTSYHGFVVNGTRPHTIEPVNAGALYWPGAAHPVMLVNHPGTHANDYPRRAAQQLVPVVRAVMGQHARVIMRQITGG